MSNFLRGFVFGYAINFYPILLSFSLFSIIMACHHHSQWYSTYTMLFQQHYIIVPVPSIYIIDIPIHCIVKMIERTCFMFRQTAQKNIDLFYFPLSRCIIIIIPSQIVYMSYLLTLCKTFFLFASASPKG